MNLREFWEKRWNTPEGIQSAHYNMLNLDSLERVLDIGCGDWEYAGTLIKNSQYIIGCDIALNALARARANTISVYKEKTDFVLCDANYLPFRKNSFDNVVSIDTLPLIGKNFKKVLEEMQRVTKKDLTFNITHTDCSPDPNGILECITFNEEEIKGLLNDLNLKSEINVFSVDRLSNWGRAIYEQTSYPDGQKKMSIFVYASK